MLFSCFRLRRTRFVDLPHGVGGVMGEDFLIVETTIWI